MYIFLFKTSQDTQGNQSAQELLFDVRETISMEHHHVLVDDLYGLADW
jgi:hypothetical protein